MLEESEVFLNNLRFRYFRPLLETTRSQGNPKDLFEAIGLEPRNGQGIAFISGAEYLGDSVILDMGKLPYLRRRFSNSQVRFFGKYAGTLLRNEWLTPILIKPQAPDTIPLIAESLDSDHFLFCWHSLAGVLAAGIKRCVALYSSLSFEVRDGQFLVYGGLSLFVPKERLALLTFNRIMGENNTSMYFNEMLKIDLPLENDLHTDNIVLPEGFSDIYSAQQFGGKLLFGDGFDSEWPKELYLHRDQFASAKDFLISEFKSASQPYVVINMNTVGLHKTDGARKDYLALLDKILSTIWLGNSSLGIFLTRPEPQFGAELADEVSELIRKQNRMISFLPNSTELWLWLIFGADYIVTQDSGFNHMSLIVQHVKKVVCFGRHPGRTNPWRKPGQTCIDLSSEDGERNLLSWIQAKTTEHRNKGVFTIE